MGTSVRPPQYILRKAWNLGRKMAHQERRIGIDLTFCYQYPSYEVFRLTNRARMQDMPAMAIWEERLQGLLQRTLNGMGCSGDNPRNWEAIDQLLTRPIRNAFWVGWEQAMDLEGLYLEVVQAHRKAERSIPVLPRAKEPAEMEITPAKADSAPLYRASRPTGAARLYPDVEEEHRLWNHVAGMIFQDLGVEDDDAFWAATGAQVERDHTGDESLDNLPNVFGPIRRAPEDDEARNLRISA